MIDKPRLMFLYFRTQDLDNLIEGLKTVPRENFISQCRYKGGKFGKDAASYFIVQLTDEEASYIALKVDMVIIKGP